jgi:hypothetical protein
MVIASNLPPFASGSLIVVVFDKKYFVKSAFHKNPLHFREEQEQ